MKKREKEFRNVTFSTSTESRTIEGFIPYNSLSEDIGFFERLSQGCFKKTLQESKDIQALYGHDYNRLLARTKNGSLVFDDRDDGLHFTFDAPETSEGDDILSMTRSGLIDGCSFGMVVMNDRWDIVDGKEVRTVLEARLFEVSLVGTPAYSETEVKCRSLSEAMGDKENIEECDRIVILEEIEKLKALLPKEEESAPAEVETDESKPTDDEEAEPTADSTVTETVINTDDEKQLEALMERFLEIEKTLNEKEAV